MKSFLQRLKCTLYTACFNNATKLIVMPLNKTYTTAKFIGFLVYCVGLGNYECLLSFCVPLSSSPYYSIRIKGGRKRTVYLLFRVIYVTCRSFTMNWRVKLLCKKRDWFICLLLCIFCVTISQDGIAYWIYLFTFFTKG